MRTKKFLGQDLLKVDFLAQSKLYFKKLLMKLRKNYPKSIIKCGKHANTCKKGNIRLTESVKMQKNLFPFLLRGCSCFLSPEVLS